MPCLVRNRRVERAVTLARKNRDVVRQSVYRNYVQGAVVVQIAERHCVRKLPGLIRLRDVEATDAIPQQYRDIVGLLTHVRSLDRYARRR